MKYRSLAVLLFASVIALAHAQDDDQQQQKPPTEIPDFSNLDEYIYQPKSTVILGFRHLSGAKTEFFGGGSIPALVDPAPGDGGRYYNDGAVRADLRSASVVNSGGNPMIDSSGGAIVDQPASPDGKTNAWNYTSQSQVDNAPLGFIAFHSYSAEITDNTVRHGSGRSSNGIDLAVSHDMGTLFGGRVKWNLVLGMSVSDIEGKKVDNVQANIKTITDLYSLYGVTPPPAPYSAPSTTPQTITDAQGNPQTVNVDNSVLISQNPVNDQSTNTTTTTDKTSVLDNWKVKGAYYTFRAGPELWVPLGSRFRIGASFGAALAYSGTTYTVIQTFTPDTGTPMTTTDTSSVYKLLPGYFADATVQFDLTDKAGFFAGAVFQSTGSYTQGIESTTSQYATKVDLTNQNGFRAGMTVRF